MGASGSPGTLVQSGSTEQCAFTGVMVVMSSCIQTTVIGTNGTDTINTNSANNGIPATINWNAGGSQQQLYTGLGSGVSSQYNNYTGASATGTDDNNVYNFTAGGSIYESFVNLANDNMSQSIMSLRRAA